MLKNKTALVTGANRGLGKMIVKKFIDNNANVICCVRKIDKEFSYFIKKIQKKNTKKIQKKYKKKYKKQKCLTFLFLYISFIIFTFDFDILEKFDLFLF